MEVFVLCWFAGWLFTLGAVCSDTPNLRTWKDKLKVTAASLVAILIWPLFLGDMWRQK